MVNEINHLSFLLIQIKWKQYGKIKPNQNEWH